MWYHTRATTILRAQYPIMQGPFGGNLSSVKLASIVSNMGGVGGYGAYTLTPDEIYQLDAAMKKATGKPYNINLWVSDTDLAGDTATETQMQQAKDIFNPYFEALGVPLPEKKLSFASRFENQVEVVLHTKPPVFSFVFGIPSNTILDQCRKLGIITAGCATTIHEAIALENAGVDMVLASGFEAGGHRPSFLDTAENSLTGTFVLLQQIKERIKTPVIAAGGIANGKAIAAALALGADGVQVGTAFLACEESNAPDFHRRMLLSGEATSTVLTRAFTGRLGRGLKNKIATETKGKEENFLPFPLQSQLMSPLRQAAIEQQQWDFMLLWGGQVSSLLKHPKAADLMNALVKETTDYFTEMKK